jgi:hypothetical protein
VGETGPFVVVGLGLGALTARMFAVDDRSQTLAVVLVDGVRAVGALRSQTQREQADLSSEGRLVVVGDLDDQSQVVVDEILSLIG